LAALSLALPRAAALLRINIARIATTQIVIEQPRWRAFPASGGRRAAAAS
jgi:hypothetical protein